MPSSIQPPATSCAGRICFPGVEPVNISLQQDVVQPGWNDFVPRAGTWAATFQPGPDSGCVPLNILGENVASAAARDWIMTTTETHSEITQQDAQAYVTGNSERWFSCRRVPWASLQASNTATSAAAMCPDALDRGGYTFFNMIEPTAWRLSRQ